MLVMVNVGSPGGTVVKMQDLQEMQETGVPSLGWEDPLAIHSSILTWKIPWTEEPDGLQSIGSQRIRHNWAHMHLWLT